MFDFNLVERAKRWESFGYEAFRAWMAFQIAIHGESADLNEELAMVKIDLMRAQERVSELLEKNSLILVNTMRQETELDEKKARILELAEELYELAILIVPDPDEAGVKAVMGELRELLEVEP